MPTYVISNKIDQTYETGANSIIYLKYGKPEETADEKTWIKYNEQIFIGNDIRVMAIATWDRWEFMLDTENGIVPITNYFPESWLGHFEIYSLFLRCKFDEFLKKY